MLKGMYTDYVNVIWIYDYVCVCVLILEGKYDKWNYMRLTFSQGQV